MRLVISTSGLVPEWRGINGGLPRHQRGIKPDNDWDTTTCHPPAQIHDMRMVYWPVTIEKLSIEEFDGRWLPEHGPLTRSEHVLYE